MAAKRSAAGTRTSVLGQVRERASEVGDLVRSGARLAKGEATERISKVSQTIRDEAARLAKDQKDWASGEIGSVGSAIHEAARKLKDNNVGSIADYVDAAAQKFDDVAHYLEDHEVNELMGGVADVVRRHPAAFIGGFLAAGILLGRFIKAGEPPPVPAGSNARPRSRRMSKAFGSKRR